MMQSRLTMIALGDDSAAATGSRKDNIIFLNAMAKFLSVGKQNTSVDMLPFIITVENMPN